LLFLKPLGTFPNMPSTRALVKFFFTVSHPFPHILSFPFRSSYTDQIVNPLWIKQDEMSLFASPLPSEAPNGEDRPRYRSKLSYDR